MNQILVRIKLNNLFEYITFFLFIIVAVSWYYYIYKRYNHSILNLLVFPISNYSSIATIGSAPGVIIITFCYILIPHSATTLLTKGNPLVYLIGAYITAVYLLFYPILWVFKFNRILKYLYFTSILLIAGYFAYITYLHKNFETWNNFDFGVQIYLLCISFYAITKIVIKDLFEEKLVDLFIFIGFVTYSFLHIVATIMLKYGFSQYFDFAVTATFFPMLFWIISVPWILRLKSNFS